MASTSLVQPPASTSLETNAAASAAGQPRTLRELVAPLVAQQVQQQVAEVKRLMDEQRHATAVPGLMVVLKRLRDMGVAPRRILDIGACKGEWAAGVRAVLPDAKFTLVEPIAYVELGAFSDVRYELLFSSETEVDWYEQRNSGDSIYRERTHHYANATPARRRTTTLDRLFGDGGASPFDLIKLDVQGAEIEVMRGGEALLRRAAFVVLEMPFFGMYNDGAPTFAMVLNYMDGLGFIPFDIIQQHREAHFLMQVDFIFVRSDHQLVRRGQEAIDSLGRQP